MKFRVMILVSFVLILSVSIGAFDLAGGSYLLYHKLDVTGLNEVLADQGFPTLDSHAIGFGSDGGMLLGDFVIGGEGYSLVLKNTEDNKTASILIEAGGFYIGRQFKPNSKCLVRLGGTFGALEKQLIIYENSGNPWVNREYSIFKGDSLWLKPQLDIEYLVLPWMSAKVSISKAFDFHIDGDNLDNLKFGRFPDLGFGLSFGF